MSAKTKQRLGAAGAVLLAAGAGTWAAIEFWPTPKPDFEFAPIDDVFNYALLTSDFNNLPVEERIEIVSTITDRLKYMSGDDGTLLAAFAAGIMGSARDQLEENMSRLMVDSWDMYSIGYNGVDPDDRAAYLEDSVVKLIRLGDSFHGMAGDKTDEEVLQTAFDQAAEDQEMFRSRTDGPSTRGKARLFSVMNETIGSNATPQQRARIGLFMRDMTAHLRGGG